MSHQNADTIIDRILVKLSSTKHITSAWQVLLVAADEAKGLDQPGTVIRPALMKILAGADGTFGTEDDLVSRDVADDLALLLQTKTFDDMVKFLASTGPVRRLWSLMRSCVTQRTQ